MQNNGSAEGSWNLSVLCLPFKFPFLCLLYNKPVQELIYIMYKYMHSGYMSKVLNSWWRCLGLRGGRALLQLVGRPREGLAGPGGLSLGWQAQICILEQVFWYHMRAGGSGGWERRTQERETGGNKKTFLTAQGSSQTSGQGICVGNFFHSRSRIWVRAGLGGNGSEVGRFGGGAGKSTSFAGRFPINNPVSLFGNPVDSEMIFKNNLLRFDLYTTRFIHL